jgi:hypothetical protein
MWPFSKKVEVEIYPDTKTESIQQFRALEDFRARINDREHQYRRGQSYNIRPGNDELAAAVRRFVDSGLVEMTNVVSKVTGTGEVVSKVTGTGEVA